MKTNYVLPSEIEKHSFEIIRAELKERGLSLDPYSNQHYFSAAFKNCQGMSPSEFRKNMLQIDRNGL